MKKLQLKPVPKRVVDVTSIIEEKIDERVMGTALERFRGQPGRRGRRGPRGPAPSHHIFKYDDGVGVRFQRDDGVWGPEILFRQQGPRGPRGERGPRGPMPRHQWSGTRLRFERPDGTWGEWVRLKGESGGGGIGRAANQGYDSITLDGNNLVFARSSAGPLGQTVTVDLSGLSVGSAATSSLAYFLGE